MNNSRLSKRKQVQLLVALTILAWATQTLFKQWGFGQEVGPSPMRWTHREKTNSFQPPPIAPPPARWSFGRKRLFPEPM